MDCVKGIEATVCLQKGGTTKTTSVTRTSFRCCVRTYARRTQRCAVGSAAARCDLWLACCWWLSSLSASESPYVVVTVVVVVGCGVVASCKDLRQTSAIQFRSVSQKCALHVIVCCCLVCERLLTTGAWTIVDCLLEFAVLVDSCRRCFVGRLFVVIVLLV